MLEAIKDRLRPVFLRKYRASRRNALELAQAAGMTEEQTALLLEGFDMGWLRGASDATAITPSELDQGRRKKTSGIH